MRRVHTSVVKIGDIDLDGGESHHIYDVLRLGEGDEIELFDDHGNTAIAIIVAATGARVTVHVDRISAPTPGFQLTIASALPKGERADWMIEKLSELGVARFVPLQTARSVVHPSGESKLTRWKRLATESAKQSRRPGIMQIEPLTPLVSLFSSLPPLGLYLAPIPAAPSLISIVHPSRMSRLALVIGPEGGWSPEELELFKAHNIPPVRLTITILRIETAAITAAALAMCSFIPPVSF